MTVKKYCDWRHSQPTPRLHPFSWMAMLAALILFIPALPSRADLVLETETAELGKKGTFALSCGVQWEREKDGSKTVFTLNQFEYAITDRAEILIEPFFHEWDYPKGAKSFNGMGDLEVTPSYMVLLEKPVVFHR
jgi:hypothetical protein